MSFLHDGAEFDGGPIALFDHRETFEQSIGSDHDFQELASLPSFIIGHSIAPLLPCAFM